MRVRGIVSSVPVVWLKIKHIKNISGLHSEKEVFVFLGFVFEVDSQLMIDNLSK